MLPEEHWTRAGTMSPLPGCCHDKPRVETLTDPRKTTALRKDMLLAGMIVLAGAVLMAVSLVELNSERRYGYSEVQAQAQSPPPVRDAAPDRGVAPATSNPDSKDNARPHDVAPEPARPNPEAQKSGAEPALPPAPAEKTAPPIKQR